MALTQEQRKRVGEVFRDVQDEALAPDDPRYVPVEELLGTDPIEEIRFTIENTPIESAQLFSGFSGTGKSTQLRRLKQALTQAGYKVVLADMAQFMNLSKAVEVSDFLLSVAGALGEAMDDEAMLGKDATRETGWTRAAAFLSRTNIEIPDVAFKAGVVDLKANLRADPTFKQQVQAHLRGHVGKLTEDVHAFVSDLVKRLRAKHGANAKLVLLVDSIERLRGIGTEEQAVQSSLAELFGGHAEKLALPSVHVVYAVPPWLRILHAGIGGKYAGGVIQIFPAVALDDSKGNPKVGGVRGLSEVLLARGCRDVFAPEQIEQVVRVSGGHLRTLLSLVAAALRKARAVPIPEATVTAAIDQIRNDFLPIAESDAVWLAAIARSHETRLPAPDKLPDLARYFDTCIALCYRNGHEWFDVHPLVREDVLRIADRVEAERRGTPSVP